MEYIDDIIGIAGVILIIIAYFLLQIDKLKSNQITYPLLNLIGALMILFSLLFAWNLSAVIMESIWALISIGGIIRIWRHEHL